MKGPTVCVISDTHNQNLHTKWSIPDADILIHCGDLTATGTESELRRGARWLGRFPHSVKLFVPGNHDKMFWSDQVAAESIMWECGVNVMLGAVCVFGLKIAGQPAIKNCGGHTLHAAAIPPDLDIMVTHCPPLGFLDRNDEGRFIGNELLLRWLAAQRNAPLLLCCGHVHTLGGWLDTIRRNYSKTFIYNAALCDDNYAPRTMQPGVFEFYGEPRRVRRLQ